MQSLRRSLNEIIDDYIQNRLPEEHKTKNKVICICLGGDIQEQVRPQMEGYIKNRQREDIAFEEWNGDKLASLILENFLREDLVPETVRSQLRKSLALLDEPDASYKHFFMLVKSLSNTESKRNKDKLRAIRQIIICLWILYAWAREEENLESAYLSSEISLLYAWDIAKDFLSQKNKISEEIRQSYYVIQKLYFQISDELLDGKIIPHVTKRHVLSNAVRSFSSLDVNLKLFDILGRLAINGIWSYWLLLLVSKEYLQVSEELHARVEEISNSIKYLISKNPILLLPIKDDQVIDISIALLLLMTNPTNNQDIAVWLSEIIRRADFAYQTCSPYPCNLYSYNDLLDHPQPGEDYRRKVTGGSVLFPMIALAAALLDCEDLYQKVQILKRKHLDHCNFQFWYPDDSSEEHFYTNSDIHGAALSHVCIEHSMDRFLEQVFAECEESSQFHSLSATQYNQWPLILVACRHYRLPIPLHLWQGLRQSIA